MLCTPNFNSYASMILGHAHQGSGRCAGAHMASLHVHSALPGRTSMAPPAITRVRPPLAPMCTCETEHRCTFLFKFGLNGTVQPLMTVRITLTSITCTKSQTEKASHHRHPSKPICIPQKRWQHNEC